MTIYIYLSETTKIKLKDMQQMFKLSISTIAQILGDHFRPNFKNYDSTFMLEYQDKEHRTKTTIKPNNCKETNEFWQTCKGDTAIISHVYSNLVYHWVNKDYQYLFNEYESNKKISKYVKQIEQIFYKTIDHQWNYNEKLRDDLRRFRRNAPYYKKVLESIGAI